MNLDVITEYLQVHTGVEKKSINHLLSFRPRGSKGTKRINKLGLSCAKLRSSWG
jgi:hypothetical protein